MAGIYIHIPFCASRCIYCGFYSTTALQEKSRYTLALCKELDLQRNYLSEPVQTIYLGGGTPSQLSRDELERIFYAIRRNFLPDCTFNWMRQHLENTMECNPDDVDNSFINTLKSVPVNRVSLGVQSFHPDYLHFARRRHSAEQVLQAVSLLRHAGITNISIDLMFGFPGQTLEQWEEDIDKALSLDVEHISAYSLTYEEGTPLYRLLEQGAVEPVSEDVSAEMYNLLTERLTQAGYEHYEISNFGKCRSRHNSSYWQETPYLGVGAAAHSYNLTSRQWNAENISEYMASIEAGTIPCECEKIDEQTRYNDLITTQLRTSSGVFIENIKEPFQSYLKQHSARLVQQGLLEVTDTHIRLTRKALFMSDYVMRELIFV